MTDKYRPYDPRHQYGPGELGLKQWILSWPVGRWTDAGLSELAHLFRIKLRRVRQVFREVEAAGFIEVGEDLTGGDAGDTDSFEVLPVPKQIRAYLAGERRIRRELDRLNNLGDGGN